MTTERRDNPPAPSLVPGFGGPRYQLGCHASRPMRATICLNRRCVKTGGRLPRLEAGQGPTLDGRGQDEPVQAIAEVGGDAAEQQMNLVGPEPSTGKPGPVDGGFALRDPPLGRPAQTKTFPSYRSRRAPSSCFAARRRCCLTHTPLACPDGSEKFSLAPSSVNSLGTSAFIRHTSIP